MQDELAASVLPQAFVPVVMAKSAGLVPVMLKELMVIGLLLVLLRVAPMVALVWPRTTLPKAMGVGSSVAVAPAVPVPCRVIDWRQP
jgi:hypothetical protein